MHKIVPCVPATLPIRNLKKGKFEKALEKAHTTLEIFNDLVKNISAKNKEKLFHLEWKSSRKLPLSAIHLMLSKRRMSLPLLCKTHALIQKDTSAYPEDVGKIRKRQNWIGPEGKGIEEAYFYPPDYKKLKTGLKNLEEYLSSSKEDPIVQIAIWFAQLLILHPFMDANGRVARLMIPLLLYQKKVVAKPLFFMSHFFKKHRLTYFHKLFLVSSKKRWEGWILFFLRGIVEEGTRVNRILRQSD